MYPDKEYPIPKEETSFFTSFWLVLSAITSGVYYFNEMLNRAVFFSTQETPPHQKTWRTVDSGIYALAFLFLAIQMVVWGNQFTCYENKKRAKRGFIFSIVTAIFIMIYEYLLLNTPIEQQKQSDYTVPFMILIFAHVIAIVAVKQIIESIGRQTKIHTGVSPFYSLFAAVLVIRYLLQFIIVIFIALVIQPWVFIYYSELVMTYIAAFITFIYTVVLILDVRKIRLAQRILLLEGEQQDQNISTVPK
ncbi:MAG: hypothetical protein ACTSYD_13810 [Candidatus Heimdallarchaeaceae archaeon]